MHPYGLALAVATLTVAAIFGFHHIVGQRDDARFRNATEAVQDNIRTRIDAYVSILLSTRSLFLSQQGDVDLGMFRAFVDGLDIERHYPGIQGVGFTQRMSEREISTVVERVRRQGQEPFRLWPEQPREEYHAIVFLEPLDRRNRAALGYDMFTEVVRHEAMQRARDSGMASASGRVTLVQEIDPQKQSGFLIYVPVYHGGAVPLDVEGRRKRLHGFVYSPFRVDDLMRGIFGSQREPRVAFDLYDGTEPAPAHLMHRGIAPDESEPRRSTVAQVVVAGRPWTMRVVSTRAFDRASSDRFLPYLGALAILVNLAFFFATRAQVRAQRDEAMAHRRLAVLADTSKRFSEARLELPVVLRTVCEEVARRLRDSCTLTLLNSAGTHLELAEAVHLNPAAEQSVRSILGRAPIPLGETSLGRVAATGQPVLVPALAREALMTATRPEYRGHLARFPIASLVVVPLRIGERIIGTLAAARSAGLPAFTPKDQQLLQEIADRAAVALENARLAQRLKEAVRLRDDFLSIAGHELKTPLAALQLQVEGLLHQAEKGAMGEVPKRLVDRLNKAQMHVGRLEILIAGLLDVSRIAAGKLAFQNEEVDLAGLLSDIIDRFSEHLARAGCQVSMRATEHVVGHWDRVRLDQVFTNLVGNALKYGAGKPIEIEVARQNGHARVAVHDHGIGISPEDRGRIFGRFERAVSERNYGGLGLGLWISQQIVQAFGGRIELQSQLGVGSTFTVELPLQQNGESSA